MPKVTCEGREKEREKSFTVEVNKLLAVYHANERKDFVAKQMTFYFAPHF